MDTATLWTLWNSEAGELICDELYMELRARGEDVRV